MEMVKKQKNHRGDLILKQMKGGISRQDGKSKCRDNWNNSNFI